MVKRPHKRAQPTGDDLNITVMDYRAGDGLLRVVSVVFQGENLLRKGEYFSFMVLAVTLW